MNSKYEFVIEHQRMHEDFNFGYEEYPSEKDGFYVGYTPKFDGHLPKSKVKIVFFVSTNYSKQNKKFIVGFYGFPEMDAFFEKSLPNGVEKRYNWGNIRSKKEDIVYFNNPIEISDEVKKSLLPHGKELSSQGFNYLTYENVVYILEFAQKRNSGEDGKIISFMNKLGIEVDIGAGFDEVIKNETADTLDGITRLEAKMKDLQPKLKEKVSTYIERGSMANKIKKHTDFKCLVCDAMSINALGFKKKNGDYYIEVHHVEPVSLRKKGSLSSSNLITICANHHRQMHYGNVIVVENTEKYFLFDIDGKKIKIAKIEV